MHHCPFKTTRLGDVIFRRNDLDYPPYTHILFFPEKAKKKKKITLIFTATPKIAKNLRKWKSVVIILFKTTFNYFKLIFILIFCLQQLGLFFLGGGGVERGQHFFIFAWRAEKGGGEI